MRVRARFDTVLPYLCRNEGSLMGQPGFEPSSEYSYSVDTLPTRGRNNGNTPREPSMAVHSQGVYDS